jgi:hypothetical protein
MGHFPLNKGINKPVELKGLVGSRYIFLLLGGLGGVFLGFIGLHVAGVNPYCSALVALGCGFGWVTRVFALSAKYGEHGAMKLRARNRQPRRIVSRHARLFKDLSRP